jgi:hypothetical protein
MKNLIFNTIGLIGYILLFWVDARIAIGVFLISIFNSINYKKN